jgi:predicted nucleic acid-binding protein
MRLIANTNRIIAALVRDSASRKIIMSGKLELVTLKFSLKEVSRHKREIQAKAEITPKEFAKLLGMLLKKIYMVEDNLITKRMKAAHKIMGQIDKADEPFIALALTIKNDGIWSDDKHFMKQKAIKVYTTAELIELI